MARYATAAFDLTMGAYITREWGYCWLERLVNACSSCVTLPRRAAHVPQYVLPCHCTNVSENIHCNKIYRPLQITLNCDSFWLTAHSIFLNQHFIYDCNNKVLICALKKIELNRLTFRKSKWKHIVAWILLQYWNNIIINFTYVVRMSTILNSVKNVRNATAVVCFKQWD